MEERSLEVATPSAKTLASSGLDPTLRHRIIVQEKVSEVDMSLIIVMIACTIHYQDRDLEFEDRLKRNTIVDLEVSVMVG